MTANNIQEFLYAFFRFYLGFTPILHIRKQLEAMRLAHVDYTHCSIYELTRSFAAKMLAPFGR